MPAPKNKKANLRSLPRGTPAQRAIASAVVEIRDRQATLLKELETLDPEVAKLAIEAVGTADAAVAWLIQPALGLEGNIPVKVLRTHAGKDRVMQLLGRIEHNVLS
jgi:uncharacterized protein (DUF2384 family)